MLKNVKKRALSALFSAAVLGLIQMPWESAAADEVTYKNLDDVGATIPMDNLRQTSETGFEFDLYQDQMNLFALAWSYVFGLDFGYYPTGEKGEENRLCPYIEAKEVTSFSMTSKDKPRSHYHVKMEVTPSVLAVVREAGCSISQPMDSSQAPEEGKEIARKMSQPSPGP